MLPLQVTIDQFNVRLSFPTTHYWYEVGMLKVSGLQMLEMAKSIGVRIDCIVVKCITLGASALSFKIRDFFSEAFFLR